MSRIDELIAELCLEGVDYRPLGELAKVFSGYAFPSTEFNQVGDGIRLIRIRDLNSGDSRTFYSGAFDARYLVEDGDLLIGMDGDFRPVRWNGGPALLNQRVCRLQEFDRDLDPGFAFHVLKILLASIQESTQESTVKHLSARELRHCSTPVPPLAIQREIASIHRHDGEVGSRVGSRAGGRAGSARSPVCLLSRPVA